MYLLSFIKADPRLGWISVVEHLSCKCKALDSTPSKKRKGKEGGRERK